MIRAMIGYPSLWTEGNTQVGGIVVVRSSDHFPGVASIVSQCAAQRPADSGDGQRAGTDVEELQMGFDPTTRAAIVGCGNMARGSVRGILADFHNTSIGVVCEPSEESYRQTADIFQDRRA